MKVKGDECMCDFMLHRWIKAIFFQASSPPSLCPLISRPPAVIKKNAPDCGAPSLALIGFILADWESAYIKASKKKWDQMDLTTESIFCLWDTTEVTEEKKNNNQRFWSKRDSGREVKFDWRYQCHYHLAPASFYSLYFTQRPWYREEAFKKSNLGDSFKL